VQKKKKKSSMLEKGLERRNIERALEQVIRNKGAGGVDGMQTEELRAYLNDNWQRLRSSILEGSYESSPVLKVEIPKPSGGKRMLGIPTVLDRLLQQAISQWLSPKYEGQFSKHSYGFRPGKNAHQAVMQAQIYVKEGKEWVVELDLEKFFDKVNHDRLMSVLSRTVMDKPTLKLIRSYLTSGILEDGVVSQRTEGTPQGSPLSPLLSNIVLDELDKELEKRGHRFVRYADDCNIYVRSQRAGERVMASIEQFLTRRLKLKVNKAKSAVAPPRKRKFLGFGFTSGKVPRRRIAPQAIARFRSRVRELTRRTCGRSLSQVAKELSRYLVGWRGYFGFCETPSVLYELDQWTRRRLRAIAWKQWKRGPNRFTKLRRRGVGREQAAQTAGSPHGPWRLSQSPALSIALPNAFFASLGLATLVPRRVA